MSLHRLGRAAAFAGLLLFYAAVRMPGHDIDRVFSMVAFGIAGPLLTLLYLIVDWRLLRPGSRVRHGWLVVVVSALAAMAALPFIGIGALYAIFWMAGR